MSYTLVITNYLRSSSPPSNVSRSLKVGPVSNDDESDEKDGPTLIEEFLER